MKGIFQFFIDNFRLSFALVFFLMIAGILGMTKVRRESRPPVDFARATITTVYPGSSPEEVEEQITTKIEDELRGIEGIKDISSISQAGRSSISIRLDIDNSDTDLVMGEVQRSVQRVRGLPSDLLEDPIFYRANAKEIPIIELALIGPNENRRRDALAKDLKNILEDTEGVAEVRLSGYREREFQILLDPSLLDRFHVGISEVVQAVKRRTQNIPAGFIKAPGNQKLVRVTGQVESACEMADIVIRSNFSGQKIRINDVAQVKDGMEDPGTLVRANGEPATLVIITKKAEADAIRTVDHLKLALDSFEKNKMHEDFKIITYNNEATRIEERLNIVVNNALTGLALVLVILLLFLPGHLGLLTALSLPFALFGTLALMPAMDVNFNSITMLALIISIGMLVDNAVVISENYARIRLEGISPRQAAIQAAYQFWLPLAATVATTIAAFLPMLVTKGVMGQFIRWIPIMVTIALSMSLLEAFFLLPARLQFSIKNLEKYRKKSKSEGQATWFDGLRLRFESFMHLCVRWRYLVFVTVGILLFGSVLLAKYGNRFELFPVEQVEYYFSSFELPISTTIDESDNVAGKLSKDVIEAIGADNVKYVIARAGVAQFGPGNSKNGDYLGMLTIAIDSEKAKLLDSKQVLKKLRSLPAKRFQKITFEAARNGPPVGQPLQVTFRSKDYGELQSLVKSFKDKIAEIDGVVDLEDDQIRGGPELRIEPRHQVLASLNLDTERVGNALRTALQGAVTTELSLQGDDFYLRIRYGDSVRAKMDALKKTKIMEPSGKLIPLLSVVNISREEGPSVRKHYNFKRSVTVSSGVIPEKITSVELNAKAQKILEPLLKNYPSVSTNFGGEAESTNESLSSLRNAMILAMFGIFLILIFLFNSFSKPMLVLSCIPLGLVGVSWAFFLHNKPLSFLAFIGIVGLAGVVVNAAIVLVSYIEEVRQNQELTMHEALALASSHRLRAVIVTGLTTVGGLFPTAYGWGGYDSLLVPLTLALAWGLVSSTLLTLIWVPCGYAIIYDLKAFIARLGGLFSRTVEDIDQQPSTSHNSGAKGRGSSNVEANP